LLNSLRFWPQPLLGLDIQAEEIRLLQLHSIFKKKQIKKTFLLDLPSGAVIEGKIHDVQTVSDCLQELVQRHQFQGAKAAIALPVQCVIGRHLAVVEGLNEAELEAEVVAHIHQCFSDVGEGLYYDYTITGPTENRQENVLWIAASFANVKAPLAVVENAGLKIQIIDVDQYALDRANNLIKKTGLSLEEKWRLSFGLALWGHCS
jgi:type IV pilus assembly protein PilM